MSYANAENLIAACAAGKHDAAYVLMHDDGAAIYETNNGLLITTLDEDTTLALRWMHPASARLMVLAIYRAAIEGERRGERMARVAA